MEARNGEQMYQPRLGKSILEIAINPAAPSKNQCIDHRCSIAVEPPTGVGGGGSEAHCQIRSF
jgi:hypothetical protein